MTRKEIEKQVTKLLKTSTITEHNKRMVKTLLSVIKLAALKKILTALRKEDKKMKQLSDKSKRIKMKYQIMVEKLCKIQLNKQDDLP